AGTVVYAVRQHALPELLRGVLDRERFGMRGRVEGRDFQAACLDDDFTIVRDHSAKGLLAHCSAEPRLLDGNRHEALVLGTRGHDYLRASGRCAAHFAGSLSSRSARGGRNERSKTSLSSGLRASP